MVAVHLFWRPLIGAKQRIRFVILLTLVGLNYPGAPYAQTYVDKDAVGASNGASWTDAFVSLQDALDCVRAAACDNQIWVAAGVYYPDEGATVIADDPAASFYLIEGAALYGGFDGVGAGGVGGTQEGLLTERLYHVNKTILSGDLQQDDSDPNNNGIISFASHIVGTNSEHVVYVNASGLGTFTSATILDGFYITAGQGAVSLVGRAPSGGGLVCDGSPTAGCDPTLANLIFRGNHSYYVGGALAAFYSNATLTNVRFTGNEAPDYGGAIHMHGSDLTITGCRFKHNSAEGGGALSIYSSSPAIVNTSFEENSATLHGGAMFNDDSSPTLTKVVFTANAANAWGGGMYNSNTAITLVGTGFFGNTASDGGAIYDDINSTNSFASTLTNVIFSGNSAVNAGGAIHQVISNGIPTVATQITNATFNENAAGSAGGAIYVDGSAITVEIVNSILWGSTDSAGSNEIHVESGQVSMRYSDLQGLGGGGVTLGAAGSFTNAGFNIALPPQFVDADGADGVTGTPDDDLHLLSFFSAAVDGGDNAAITLPIDYEGDLRKKDGDLDGAKVVDMGAYEL